VLHSGGDCPHVHMVRSPAGGVRLGAGESRRSTEKTVAMVERGWRRGGRRRRCGRRAGDATEIFLGTLLREAVGDEVFYELSNSWSYHPCAAIYRCGAGESVGESLRLSTLVSW
jgi:hypothetical protein